MLSLGASIVAVLRRFSLTASRTSSPPSTRRGTGPRSGRRGRPRQTRSRRWPVCEIRYDGGDGRAPGQSRYPRRPLPVAAGAPVEVPTFDVLARFLDDYKRLTSEQREAFLRARDALVDDLRTGRGFRPGLRIRRVQSTTDVWELTWAPDGRATWQYGAEQVPGEPHVVWRRIGTHAIFVTHDGRPARAPSVV